MWKFICDIDTKTYYPLFLLDAHQEEIINQIRFFLFPFRWRWFWCIKFAGSKFNGHFTVARFPMACTKYFIYKQRQGSFYYNTIRRHRVHNIVISAGHIGIVFSCVHSQISFTKMCRRYTDIDLFSVYHNQYFNWNGHPVSVRWSMCIVKLKNNSFLSKFPVKRQFFVKLSVWRTWCVLVQENFIEWRTKILMNVCCVYWNTLYLL